MHKPPMIVKMQKVVIFGILFFFVISSVFVLVNWDQISSSSTTDLSSSNEDPVIIEIRQWEGEVAKDPNNPFNHRNLGLAYLKANKLDSAFLEYDKASQLDPKDDISERFLGEINYLKGKPAEALKHFDKAIAINPYLPEVHFRLGEVLASLKKYNNSASSFKKAAEINPALYSQGKALLEKYLETEKKERNDKAVTSLEEALNSYQKTKTK